MVRDAHPAPLPGKDLEDKRLHNEGYHDLEDDQRDDVEAQEVQSHQPVQVGIKFRCIPFLQLD